MGTVATAPDPAEAFLEASLMGQRAIINALCVVRLHNGTRGRLRRDREGREVIDPSTLDFEWRQVTPAQFVTVTEPARKPG